MKSAGSTAISVPLKPWGAFVGYPFVPLEVSDFDRTMILAHGMLPGEPCSSGGSPRPRYMSRDDVVEATLARYQNVRERIVGRSSDGSFADILVLGGVERGCAREDIHRGSSGCDRRECRRQSHLIPPVFNTAGVHFKCSSVYVEYRDEAHS